MVSPWSRQWLDILGGREGPEDAENAYEQGFAVSDEDTLESLLATGDEVKAATEATVAALDSLDVRVQLPPAPWYPENPDGYSARWILLHVLEELARHAGHADILREQIDGATMYELMAGAEGWPETEWIKPWRPGPESGTRNGPNAIQRRWEATTGAERSWGDRLESGLRPS